MNKEFSTTYIGYYKEGNKYYNDKGKPVRKYVLTKKDGKRLCIRWKDFIKTFPASAERKIKMIEFYKKKNNNGFLDYLPIRGLQCNRKGEFRFNDEPILPIPPVQEKSTNWIIRVNNERYFNKTACDIVYTLFGNPNLVKNCKIDFIDGNIRNLHIDNLECKRFPKNDIKKPSNNEVYIDKDALQTLIANNRQLAKENYELKKQLNVRLEPNISE